MKDEKSSFFDSKRNSLEKEALIKNWPLDIAQSSEFPFTKENIDRSQRILDLQKLVHHLWEKPSENADFRKAVVAAKTDEVTENILQQKSKHALLTSLSNKLKEKVSQ